MRESGFFDEATIVVKAGSGGAGAVSFRREKFVPFGGPDGGDGGRGGSVYLRADPRLNTLLPFRYERIFSAGAGGAGSGRKKHGKKGEDKIIAVPPGTVVREVKEDGSLGSVLADLVVPGQQVLVARGGRGGLGNTHFATSTNQAPRFAQKGEPGETKTLHLELRLIADVGLLGFPNVGKSTLLAAVSAAKPKIGDYPFTTLTPNLGVVEVDDRTFVMADIPGLIEGASQGKGLGHDFLRHVQRTRLLLHLIDGTSEHPREDFDRLNAELAAFDPDLAAKRQIIVLTKQDLPEAQERLPAARAAFSGLPVFPISAATGAGLSELLRATAAALAEEEAKAPPVPAAEELPVIRPKPAVGGFEVLRHGRRTYQVAGQQVERMVAMTDLANEEAFRHLMRNFNRLGVPAALQHAGITPGAKVTIGGAVFQWTELGLQWLPPPPPKKQRSSQPAAGRRARMRA
ncbi:MAG: GTPase ObgE [Chloroflexota bacterium]|nr:GTPase ObgE [Dehalococcoidia bacterium]MDW8255222.1 GTPase ObgE [Chloroflexota bacterium]